MNSSTYQYVLVQNLKAFLKKLKIKRTNPKFTKIGLHQNKIKVLEWSGQSPVLDPIEHLWGDKVRMLLQESTLTQKDIISLQQNTKLFTQ